MPIKFHCNHCGMHLGISRSKVGTVVDCPACGRSVRVPKKDGQAEAVGRPSLNHDDSEIAQALEKVASIGQSTSRVIPQLPPSASDSHNNRETREVLAPPPQIIPAEPQPRAEPITPAADLPMVPETEETFVYRGGMDQLATLAAEQAAIDAESEPIASTETNPSNWVVENPWKLWLAFIVVGFVAVIAGFTLGQWDQSTQTEQNQSQSVASVEEAFAKQYPELVTQLGNIGVSGILKSADETPEPRAWVYAFPKDLKSARQIPADWLTATDPEQYETGHQLVLASLRVLGGNAVQTDANGQFELRLKEPGEYGLLLCSTTSEGSTSPTDAIESLLTEYFANPKDFLDGRNSKLISIDYTGDPITLNDVQLDP